MEPFSIEHDRGSTVKYRRVNHADFKYKIKIQNLKGEKDNVMVRIWLGLLARKDDIR